MARSSSWIACLLAASLLACGAAGGTPADDKLIEDALKQVRDVKKDMFEGQSSVLGKLPDPEEMARQQLRTRPISKIDFLSLHFGRRDQSMAPISLIIVYTLSASSCSMRSILYKRSSTA